jgi:predicted ATP-grasp superfamily ATP-dependent carboligase
MNDIFVLDGRSRAALAIVRSLGKHGFKITSGEAFNCSTFYSKYTNKKYIYPEPKDYPDIFLKSMISEVKLSKYDMIIPVRDETTEILSKNILKLSKYTKIPTPPYETYKKGRDKKLTIKLAETVGIPHPKTIFIEESRKYEFKELKKELGSPFLLKPRESSGSRGIIKVATEREYDLSMKITKQRYGLPIVQEFIPYGGAYGVSMLFNQGEPRAIFTHKRLREYPITGGPSTFRESVRDELMEKYATKLLKALDWHGVAMVEFRVDSRTNEPKLMEINPRFWGSLPLAVASGVDFPYLLYKMTMDGDVKPVMNYKTGVKVRWFLLGEILWFMDSPKNIRNLSSFLKLKDKNLGYDVLSLDDIGPSIGAVMEGARSLMKKKRRQHAFDRGWS